jgi:glycosyltransferase involved in cell wall biosynthesis
MYVMTKVSIIIPLHNSEAYIAETIESCLAQTHENIEIIVVENGSNDKSYQLVKAFDDKRLQIYQRTNANAAAARNYGYQKATGAYLLFLDADDVLGINKIELQLAALSKNPEGWVASCAWAKFEKSTKEAIIKPQNVWNIQNPIDWCVTSWMGGGMMIPGCWLIPRAIIKEAGLWDERLSLHDDGAFMCRILLASKGNIFVKNTVVYYRQVTSSLSRQNKSFKAATSALEVYKSYEQQILEHQDTMPIRLALAYNYMNFIYQFYSNYKPLIHQAKGRLAGLDIDTLPLVGGRLFRKIQQYIGFYNALKLKQIINNK